MFCKDLKCSLALQEKSWSFFSSWLNEEGQKTKNSSIIRSDLLFASFPKASFRSKPQAIPNAKN